MKVPSRLVWGIMVVAACVPDAATAYSYPDARVTPYCTSSQFSCLLEDTGKGLMIDVSGQFSNPSTAESKILELNPVLVPSAPFMVKQLTLHLQADDSGNWIISIRKTVGGWDQPGFTVMYKLTDIALPAQSSPSRYLRLRFYVMTDQLWIEARTGDAALALVRTMPVFFGYGEARQLRVNVNQQVASGIATRFGTFSPTDLYEQINLNYTYATSPLFKGVSTPPTLPFAFRKGTPSQATALLQMPGAR